MGEIKAKIKLTNNDDLVKLALGIITEREVRSVEVDGLIDTGATLLNLPEELVEKLGLTRSGHIQVRYANNARELRPRAGVVQLELLGRDGPFDCVVGPPGSPILVGQIILETLDLIADCTTGTLKYAHEEGIVYSAMGIK